MYARMYACAYDCGQIVIRTHDHDQHTNGQTNGQTNGTQDATGKRATANTKIKFAYIIGVIAKNDKKNEKKVKKNLVIKKKAVPLHRNQKTKQVKQ